MIPHSFVLRGGLLLNPAIGEEGIFDLRVCEGRITDLEQKIKERSDEHVIDLSGMWVCPGFIDLHTHLRDPGQTEKEDVDSGTLAAAAGGYTTVLCIANTDPPIDNATTLSLLQHKIKSHAHISRLADCRRHPGVGRVGIDRYG
jgi:dihydroorotase